MNDNAKTVLPHFEYACLRRPSAPRRPGRQVLINIISDIVSNAIIKEYRYNFNITY